MGQAAAKKKADTSKLADALADGLAGFIVWGFGLATVAAVFQAAFALVQTPGAAFSVFGHTDSGATRQTIGLTYSADQAFFSRLGVTALDGMEGAFLASAQAVLILVALLTTLMPSSGPRRFGSFLLASWVGLWLYNAGSLAYAERFHLVLTASTVLLGFIFACAVHRFVKALRAP